MRKVNLQVLRPWIVKRVVELLGFEDEVVVEYAMGLLEDKANPVRLLTFLRRIRTDRIDFLSLDARSEENANQSHGIPNK